LDLWEEQDAKRRFSELSNATIKKGPQIITRCGVETAVLVTIEEWNRLKKAAGSGLRASVRARDARFESLIPEKRKLRRRAGLEHVQLYERDSRRDLDRLEKTLAPNAKLLASARMLPKRSRP
jgi:antitoxin Phd